MNLNEMHCEGGKWIELI